MIEELESARFVSPVTALNVNLADLLIRLQTTCSHRAAIDARDGTSSQACTTTIP